ncbi:NAD(P)/FAD-dependent oxidoreductase [Saccharopolyspora sp. 6V]|uniref:flavin-containing monooxygenase n=1 Tax=Saccharopolyspora sp. 6V TaxID=2877239 RepID=UPI001CD2D338|nr:NAD(P)/FAD-dependent oxidoreductase [Saccharopolyspora sp. 6V]MCA1196230.1 NAD(P)/FAD-dependent oxidoreductase [Saccharopolyspora sp. 6V]
MSESAVGVEHVDVVVVGAGLSGVGAAYRVKSECPGRSLAVLEARDVSGGTWDLFRYPGVRSDSDMATLGYPFRPWRGSRPLADGASILEYVRATAAEFGIEGLIRYRTKVVAAEWSSAESRWTLRLAVRGADGGVSERVLTCGFLYSCAGYYDYERGNEPVFPGVESFGGELVHPQFWPEGLDYAGKRVVVIGSGATAVTLVPAMAREAARVTMLQRSPTWISPVPGRDRKAERLRAWLPERVASRLVRWKNIAFSTAFFQFCQHFPRAARGLLTRVSARALRDEAAVREHFTPSYDPWDQRLCAVPDGDLFGAVREGRAEVVTDHVESFVPEGVRLRSGRVLAADVVVSATGLRLLAFGGISLRVDGRAVELSEEFVWRGAMVSGVPNFAVCIGYTNASWTLRADLSSRLVCRVLGLMGRRGWSAVVPVPGRGLRARPLLDLASGYVQRSIGAFPRQGDRGSWRVRQNYPLDAVATLRGGLARELVPVPVSGVRSPAVTGS